MFSELYFILTICERVPMSAESMLWNQITYSLVLLPVDHRNTGVFIHVSKTTVAVCRVGAVSVRYRRGTPGVFVLSAEDAIFSIPDHGNTDLPAAGDSRYSSILQCFSIEEC